MPLVRTRGILSNRRRWQGVRSTHAEGHPPQRTEHSFSLADPSFEYPLILSLRFQFCLLFRFKYISSFTFYNIIFFVTYIIIVRYSIIMITLIIIMTIELSVELILQHSTEFAAARRVSFFLITNYYVFFLSRSDYRKPWSSLASCSNFNFLFVLQKKNKTQKAFILIDEGESTISGGWRFVHARNGKTHGTLSSLAFTENQ